MDHPPWCKPDACTAHDNPSPSLRRAHRGGIARIDTSRPGRHSTITTMLIQDVGDTPRLVVTAAGYAHTRMVELGTAGMQQLIDNLCEQLAAARDPAASLDPPADPDRPADLITHSSGA